MAYNTSKISVLLILFFSGLTLYGDVHDKLTEGELSIEDIYGYQYDSYYWKDEEMSIHYYPYGSNHAIPTKQEIYKFPQRLNYSLGSIMICEMQNGRWFQFYQEIAKGDLPKKIQDIIHIENIWITRDITTSLAADQNCKYKTETIRIVIANHGDRDIILMRHSLAKTEQDILQPILVNKTQFILVIPLNVYIPAHSCAFIEGKIYDVPYIKRYTNTKITTRDVNQNNTIKATLIFQSVIYGTDLRYSGSTPLMLKYEGFLF